MSLDPATNGSVYICIKQFNARLADELNLKVGDKVEVLADDSEYNDGWFMGKNLLTNDVGLYPKSFTQLLTEKAEGQTLLRSRSRRLGSNKIPSTPSNTNGRNSSSNTPSASVGKLSDNLEKLSVKNPQTPVNGQVNRTMSEIDKALQEIQSDIHEDHKHEPEDSTPKPSTKHKPTKSITEDLNPMDAINWNPQQVSSYFALVLGFDVDVAGKLARHKITGAILFQLDLAHLKELDIDSFGTRFEVYKEIENLKQLGKKNNNKLIDDSSVLSDDTNDSGFKSPYNKSNTSYPHNNSDEDTSYSHHVYGSNSSSRQVSSSRGHSQSQSQLLPSASIDQNKSVSRQNTFSRRHQRKRSQSMENIPTSAEVLQTPGRRKSAMITTPELSFMSPRKAPEPPTHSPLNKSFKFGDENTTPSSSSNLYVTRTNASSAGLGISNTNQQQQSSFPSRPASSVYENSLMSGDGKSHHRRNSSTLSGVTNSNNGVHKRHSSLFSFLSGQNEKGEDVSTLKSPGVFKSTTKSPGLSNPTTPSQLVSPANVKRRSRLESPLHDDDTEYIDIDNTQLSPRKSKSLNRKSKSFVKPETRSTSDSNVVTSKADADGKEGSTMGRLKTLRTASTQNFRNLTGSKKLKTSAFQEGIQAVAPDEAIKTANYSGWMSKKSGNTLGWRSRFFTLHGTRLSYFGSLRDKKEKGLIDITAHKVIPINTDSDATSNSNDKYIAMYASSTGFGRYCFKLVPPAPGFKKGLTFTQPKNHYFAVETYEEMRGWIKALMTATIDIDDSVPVVSSCSTPTVSLSKARELLAKAREETMMKDEELRAKGFIRDGYENDFTESSTSNTYNDFLNNKSTNNESLTSEEDSPLVGSLDDSTVSSVQRHSADQQGPPKLSVDTTTKNYKSASSTPQGFTSPYLLASGLLSPKLGTSLPPGSPTTNGAGTPSTTGSKEKKEYFSEYHAPSSSAKEGGSGSSTPKSIGRMMSGGLKKKDKLLAYSNDGSGNHTFVIKKK